MNQAEKQNTIEELKDLLNTNSTVYLADTSSLPVDKINKLRRMCFDKGIEMVVSKNTLLRKAMEAADGNYEEIYPVLHGPTSILLSDTGNLPAKLIKEFRQDGERPVLKGAYIESAVFIGDNRLDDLSRLKSRLELIGDIVGLLQSPPKNVISALKSGGGKLAGILKTLSER